MKTIDPDAWELIEQVNLVEDRIFPEAGGTNDQTSVFWDAVRYVKQVKREIAE